ncbi:MAG: outer membrane beta-barrel protein [Sphingomonas sp.]
MHPTIKLAALAAALCAGAGTASAQSHFYIAGAATGSDPSKPAQTIGNAPTTGSTLQVENAIDFHWGGQAEIGYQQGFLRVEAEFGRTTNHSDAYTAISPISATLPQDGKNEVSRYMLNAFVELPRGRWFVSPFAGVGIGAARGHVTTFGAPARAPTAPPSQLIDARETNFAWQAMAGLALPIVPHVALTAQYRWLDAGTVNGVDSRGEPITRKLHGSNYDFGVRVQF